MKARPILFNTDMVKAILAGQKTQTRREVKAGQWWKYDGEERDANGRVTFIGESWIDETECPFGQPGDLLYVRETWQEGSWPSYEPVMRLYAANPADHIELQERGLKWRPSIHMPRRLSRLTLEITDVRVERLQDISEEDAKAEGFELPVVDDMSWKFKARHNFRFTWNSIYSNWDANPWVWVVEFKVHHCNVDALLREREAA